MKKVVLTVLLAGLGIVLATTATASGLLEPKSVKEIMKEAHGKGGLLGKIGTAVKAKKFDDAATGAADLVKLADDLVKNEPKKGEKESWEKLTKAYHDNAKALEEAVGNKDGAKAGMALKNLTGSCGSCHKAHR